MQQTAMDSSHETPIEHVAAAHYKHSKPTNMQNLDNKIQKQYQSIK